MPLAVTDDVQLTIAGVDDTLNLVTPPLVRGGAMAV